LVFAYQEEPKLSAAVLFAEAAGSPLQLRFTNDTAATNPHRRILPLLQNLLSTGATASALEEARKFENLLDLMTATLPVLTAISSIEAADPSGKMCKVGVRSLAHFRVSYLAPLAAMTLDVELKRVKGTDVWTITLQKDGMAKEDVEKSLDLLEKAWKGRGLESKGVKGFRSGVVAEIQGVREVLVNLEQVVRGTSQGDGGEGREVILLD
jgi:mediator of RNA polymerase II transcription subunit 14